MSDEGICVPQEVGNPASVSTHEAVQRDIVRRPHSLRALPHQKRVGVYLSLEWGGESEGRSKTCT